MNNSTEPDGEEICLITDDLSARFGEAVYRNIVPAVLTVIFVYVMVSNIVMIVGILKTTRMFTLVHRMYILLSSIDFLISFVAQIRFMLPHFRVVQEIDIHSCLFWSEVYVSIFRTLYIMEALVLLSTVAIRYLMIIHSQQFAIYHLLKKKSSFFVIVLFIVVLSVPPGAYRQFLQEMTLKEKARSHGVFYSVVTTFLFSSVLLNLRFLHVLRTRLMNPRKMTNSNVKNSRHKQVSMTLFIMCVSTLICNIPYLVIQILLISLIKIGEHEKAHEILLKNILWASMISIAGFGLNSNIFVWRCRNIRRLYITSFKKTICCVKEVEIQDTEMTRLSRSVYTIMKSG